MTQYGGVGLYELEEYWTDFDLIRFTQRIIDRCNEQKESLDNGSVGGVDGKSKLERVSGNEMAASLGLKRMTVDEWNAMARAERKKKDGH